MQREGGAWTESILGEIQPQAAIMRWFQAAKEIIHHLYVQNLKGIQFKDSATSLEMSQNGLMTVMPIIMNILQEMAAHICLEKIKLTGAALGLMGQRLCVLHFAGEQSLEVDIMKEASVW